MSTKPATPTAALPPQVSSKKTAKKTAKPKTKRTHPSAAEMVMEAVENLRDRNGSSLQAIKKYIVENYEVDIDRQAIFIKKFLQKAAGSGTLTRTKGQGATGSFKLPVKDDVNKSRPKALRRFPSSPKKISAEEKKAVAAKKPVKRAMKKSTPKKVGAKSKKTKMSIAKKTVKPLAKPKTPKAKKAIKKK